MVCGVGAGIVGAVLLLLLRRGLRVRWTAGFTVAVVLFVALGVVAPVVLPTAAVRDARPVADPFGRATARLGSPDLDERVAGIHQLELFMWRYGSPHQPSITTTLSAFVRERAPVDARCGGREPAEDVELATTVLGRRPTARDGDTVLDLHGVCLALIELSNKDFRRANLAGVDLTGAGLTNTAFDGADLTSARLAGANLRHSNLVDVDLTGTDLDGVDLGGTRWSDGTTWPPEYEPAVLAASSFDTTDYVISELRLPDRH